MIMILVAIVFTGFNDSVSAASAVFYQTDASSFA
jgi:hypothetical protein